MGQVEELCSDIALIDKGEFILEGKLTEIKERFKKNIFEIKYHGDFPDLNREGFEVETHQPGVALVRIKEQISYSQILKRLSDFIEIYSFMELYPTLNDIFIEQVTTAKQGVVNE